MRADGQTDATNSLRGLRWWHTPLHQGRAFHLRRQRRRRNEDGRATAFAVVLTTGILALAGLTLDGGLALAAKVTANGQAEAAARAGAQAIDLAAYRSTGTFQLVPTEAVVRAQRYLATIGASGTVTVTRNAVTVTVITVHHTQLLGLVGISRLSVHGAATAQPYRGIAEIEP